MKQTKYKCHVCKKRKALKEYRTCPECGERQLKRAKKELAWKKTFLLKTCKEMHKNLSRVLSKDKRRKGDIARVVDRMYTMQVTINSMVEDIPDDWLKVNYTEDL